MRTIGKGILGVLIGCSTRPAAPSTAVTTPLAPLSTVSLPRASSRSSSATPPAELEDASVENDSTGCMAALNRVAAAARSSTFRSRQPAQLRRCECSAENSNLCTPQVFIESWRAGDPDHSEQVRRQFRQELGRFRACYETELRGNPRLAARWSVSATAGSSGALCSLKSSSENAPAEFIGCLDTALRGLWPQLTNVPEIVEFDMIFFTKARQFPTGGRL